MIYQSVLTEYFGFPDLSEEKRAKVIETIKNSDINGVQPQTAEKSEYCVCWKHDIFVTSVKTTVISLRWLEHSDHSESDSSSSTIVCSVPKSLEMNPLTITYTKQQRKRYCSEY